MSPALRFGDDSQSASGDASQVVTPFPLNGAGELTDYFPRSFPILAKITIRTWRGAPPQVSKASERVEYFIKNNRDDNFRHPCNLLFGSLAIFVFRL